MVQHPLKKKKKKKTYGSTLFEDHFGDLFKLVQLGYVRNYQLQFETPWS
jgi:hypothetical protein